MGRPRLAGAGGALFGSGSFYPLPTALGLGALLGLPLVVAAVVLSVQLGRRAQQPTQPAPRQRLATGAANAVLALLAVVAVVAVQQRGQSPSFADNGPYGYGTGYAGPVSGPLAHADGTPITNVYPWSSTGEPLTGVLLYDQDGRPLDNLSTTTHDGLPVERVVVPGAPPQPAHAFPQQQVVERDDDQGFAPVPTAPVLLPPPAVTLPTPTSPTPTPATPTPTLSGTRAVLERAGHQVVQEGGMLQVAVGGSPAELTRLLAAHGHYLSELTPVAVDLEAAFLALTQDAA